MEEVTESDTKYTFSVYVGADEDTIDGELDGDIFSSIDFITDDVLITNKNEPENSFLAQYKNLYEGIEIPDESSSEEEEPSEPSEPNYPSEPSTPGETNDNNSDNISNNDSRNKPHYVDGRLPPPPSKVVSYSDIY